MREPPTRTNGAAWMIRLGALLMLCTPAVERFFVEFWTSPTFQSGPQRGIVFHISPPIPENMQAALRGTFILACLMPSLACTFGTWSPRRDLLTLLAFFPISAAAALFSHGAAGGAAPWMPIPPAVGAAVPLILAIPIAAAWRNGEDPREVAPVSRFVIAVDLLWLILLGWNAEGLAPAYLPAWVGVAGSLLVAPGELLRRPAPMDS